MSSAPLSRITTAIVLLINLQLAAFAQVLPVKCPPSDAISPCKCHVIRSTEYQIWCSHSDLQRVTDGLKKLSAFISRRPIDELILENNNLAFLPARTFHPLNVLRLMLRHNRLERVAPDVFAGLEDVLMELYVVEPDLRTLPQEVFDRLRNLEAITLQSNAMKRLPKLHGLERLRYLQVESPSLMELTARQFRRVPFIEKVHVSGSPRLTRLDAGTFKDMTNLNLINLTHCGLTWLHPRAFAHLPNLIELSLVGNNLRDAAMIGRAVKDLSALQVLRLDHNEIDALHEGSFVDLPSLKRLHLASNRIEEIRNGAFRRVPSLRTVDLNDNAIKRIHPDSFIQHSDSGVEELSLVDNDIGHASELRALLDALPRLVFLDLSRNRLEEIRFGELRGHPTLERLHLDHNQLRAIDREAFVAMPALRELRLTNNSLSDLSMGPLWNLPSLKGLDLSGNYYRAIDANLLMNTPALRKIDVSRNEIVFLDAESFGATPAVESMNLSRNGIASIHPSTFRHLHNLYEIDLSHNRIIDVVPGLPRRLEYLHLSKNLISVLPYDTPELDLPALRMLDVSGNLLTTIQSGAFRRLPQLRKLYASHNAIERIDESSFDGLLRLEILDCRSNRIRDVHPYALKEMIELRELNLNDNHLIDLRPETFESLPRLRRLHLRMNRLNELLPAVFENVRDVELLDLSYNALGGVPSTLRGLKHLKRLDLNRNRVRNVNADHFDGLAALNELVLSGNLLKKLRARTFGKNLKNLRTLLLDNNQIESIESNAVASLPSLVVLDLSNNKIRSMGDGAVKDLPQLQVLELQANEIRSLNKDAFKSLPHLMMLNVSHNRLSQIDDAGVRNLHSLEILDVSHNDLNRVAANELTHLEWLVELRADDNKICAIQGPAFNALPRLKVLSLRNNNMMSFPEDAIKDVRTNIAILDLEGNPLACTCNLLWLQTWLMESSAFGPRCLDGTLLREYRFSRQECSQEPPQTATASGCEAELLSGPGLAQLIANATKASYIKNHLAPSPEESEYFYEDYVDYPYNETGDIDDGFVEPVQLIDKSTKKPHVVALQNVSSHFVAGDTPTIYAASGNKTKRPPQQVPGSPSSSGFTFFGLPLPAFGLNKLWNGGNGRMDDNLPMAERKSAIVNRRPPFLKIDRPSQPEFQTGGFKPLLPGTGGFKPIVFNGSSVVNDNQTIAAGKDNVALHSNLETRKNSVTTQAPLVDTTTIVNRRTTTASMYKTMVRQQISNKTAIRETKSTTVKTPTTMMTASKRLEPVTPAPILMSTTTTRALLGTTIPVKTETTTPLVVATTEPSTTAASVLPLNSTKGTLEVASSNSNVTKIQTKLSIESTANTIFKTYNNTIRSINRTANDTVNKKVADEAYGQIEVAPDVSGQRSGTLLTDFLVPKQQQQPFRGVSTITKVPSPQQQLQEKEEETLVINPLKSAMEAAVQNNRETKQVKLKNDFEDGKSWYFANYNNTNLTPYIGSRVEIGTNSDGLIVEVHKIVFMIPVVIFNIV